MKKILFLALFAISSLFADLKWVKYNAALEEAKKSDKLIMVMLSRKDCPACEYMQDIVFYDKNVAAKVNENFISVYIDIDNDRIPNGLNYIGTPTFHFLNQYEIKKHRIDGGMNVKDFTQEIQMVLEKK